MIKVRVLEHFPVEYHDRKVRKERWLQTKSSYETQGVFIDMPEPLLDMEGQKVDDKLLGIDGKPFTVEGYELIFVHHSDRDRYVDDAVNRAIPVVCYGAGGERLDIGRIGSMVIDFLPLTYLESNIKQFFDKVALDQGVTADAFNTLIGFAPDLEARLELLHLCLTPEGAKTVINGEFSSELNSERMKFWTVKLSSLCPTVLTGDSATFCIDLTVKELVDKLGRANDGFAEEYLTMLSLLQRCLLPSE